MVKSLPKSQEVKVTVIQEAKDLTKIPLDERVVSLMTPEITMKKHMEENQKKRRKVQP